MRRTVISLAIAMAFLTAVGRAPASTDGTMTAPVPGCDAMEVGPVYDAAIDAASTLACFQLAIPVFSTDTKLDVNFAGFEPGAKHDVSLVRVRPDGSMQAVASDTSVDSLRIVQGVKAASTRWLVLVGRPAAGAASPFQMQATLAYGSDRYEPNDSVANATALRGNQHIEGNLDSPADVDRYLLTLRADQTRAIVEFEAAANVVAELIDGTNQPRALQVGKPLRVDSSRPLFISVRGGDATEGGARYTLRTRDPHAIAVVSTVHSKENISHLAPGREFLVPGGANAARTLEVAATVFEGDAVTPVGAGQDVVFSAFDLEGTKQPIRRWQLATAEAVTDDEGIAHATLDIGPCRGGVLGPIRVPTRGSPPDFWDITYNPASAVVAIVPDSDAQPSFGNRKAVGRFQHVCKEVFRRRQS